MKTIQNGCNIPLNANSGTVPNMSESLANTLQQITFTKITKAVQNGQVLEVPDPVNFQGSWVPFSLRQLVMKPEGQRRWKWYMVCALTALPLVPDDVVNYLGTQYRVMQVNDFKLYGFFEYHIVDDYSGSGP